MRSETPCTAGRSTPRVRYAIDRADNSRAAGPADGRASPSATGTVSLTTTSPPARLRALGTPVLPSSLLPRSSVVAPQSRTGARALAREGAPPHGPGSTETAL